VVGKLCSSKRQQNALAAAIKEYGALRRTVYAARYLADETYRRHKGENLHALKRSLAYAGAGALRRRHHEQQAEQMWCLTLATNAIVTWTTEYNGMAVTALRRAGRDIDDAVLAHIWPAHHENVPPQSRALAGRVGLGMGPSWVVARERDDGPAR
jgi:TnpA family transposase